MERAGAPNLEAAKDRHRSLPQASIGLMRLDRARVLGARGHEDFPDVSGKSDSRYEGWGAAYRPRGLRLPAGPSTLRRRGLARSLRERQRPKQCATFDVFSLTRLNEQRSSMLVRRAGRGECPLGAQRTGTDRQAPP